MNDVTVVFDREYLAGDTASGDVEQTVSSSVPVSGNRIVIEATLIAASSIDATNKLILLLEGTYDGKSWWTLYSTNKVEFASSAPNTVASTTLAGISFSAVRLRATINGIAAKAIFSASIAFSEQ